MKKTKDIKKIERVMGFILDGELSYKITPDGWAEVIEAKDEKTGIFTLEELQEYVEGFIEVLFLKRKYYMVCNEEGWIIGLRPNHLADRLSIDVFGRTYSNFVGNVLLIPQKYID